MKLAFVYLAISEIWSLEKTIKIKFKSFFLYSPIVLKRLLFCTWCDMHSTNSISINTTTVSKYGVKNEIWGLTPKSYFHNFFLFLLQYWKYCCMLSLKYTLQLILLNKLVFVQSLVSKVWLLEKKAIGNPKKHFKKFFCSIFFLIVLFPNFYTHLN